MNTNVGCIFISTGPRSVIFRLSKFAGEQAWITTNEARVLIGLLEQAIVEADARAPQRSALVTDEEYDPFS